MSEKGFEDNNGAEVVEVKPFSLDFNSIGKDPYASLGEQVSQAAGNAIRDIMENDPSKTVIQAIGEFLFGEDFDKKVIAAQDKIKNFFCKAKTSEFESPEGNKPAGDASGLSNGVNPELPRTAMAAQWQAKQEKNKGNYPVNSDEGKGPND